MASLIKCIFGPRLYSIHRPHREYEANIFEKSGDWMLYSSGLVRAIAWPTSPFWIYYLATRISWNRADSLFYIQWILVFHLLAFFTRTVGRSFNSTYREFIKVYSEAVSSVENNSELLTRLRNYDFQIMDNSPVSFTAKDNPALWYLSLPGRNIHGSALKIWTYQVLAYLCVHSFGRRMLYPGSLGILKTILFPYVLSSRLKLILQSNGERFQIRASDGNIIDGILFDRRELFHNDTLIICCDGNGGFYETGITKTPVDSNYSVLGWNPPGFSESTGSPYPRNILNSMDAILQFAFSRGFKAENIVIFGWSIGGFPATWATANYPKIGGLILDASFDHVLPLALAAMPSFASEIVTVAIHDHFNLDVATQLEKYDGPVHIIRRYNDEVVTSYHGPNEYRRRRENRGNHLLARFMQGRYPDVLKNETDTEVVFSYLEITGFGEEQKLCEESRDALISYELPYIMENDDLRHHLIRLLCSRHFSDIQATHITPLKSEELIVPHAVNYKDFKKFLQSINQ